MKHEPRSFCCNLEGHFKSECTQFWDAVVDAKHSRHKEAILVVKVSRACLINEAELPKEEVSQGTFTNNKKKTLSDDTSSWSVEAVPSRTLRVDCDLVARTALQKIQQELAMEEVEEWMRFEVENTELREKLDTPEKTVKTEENGYSKSRGLKMNVISWKNLAKTRLCQSYRFRVIR